MKLHIRLFISCLLALATATLAHAETPAGVAIYYSAQSNYQLTLAAALNKQLNINLSDTPVKYITDSNLGNISDNDIIISIGNQDEIDSILSKYNNDIIYINDTRDQNSYSHFNKSYTNISITQPPCRHLNLISILNKQWRRVGYLKSKAGDTRLSQLQECSKKLGLKIVDITVIDGNVSAAIDTLVQNSDVLLAMPDNRIYNRHSIKNVLLSTYRLRIPVIGFSESFVNAGAMAATYSTPEQIAQQLISVITSRLKRENTPAHNRVYPIFFSVGTNKQVAKALNLSLPDDDYIKSSLQYLEGAQ